MTPLASTRRETLHSLHFAPHLFLTGTPMSSTMDALDPPNSVPTFDATLGALLPRGPFHSKPTGLLVPVPHS